MGEFQPSETLLSNEVRATTELFLDLIVSFIISLIGVISNTFVIIVFAKQGFKESMNISMTTIALWDFVKSLGGAMQRMAGPMMLWSKPDAESWTNIGVPVFSTLICFSSYVSSVLAAYVAVERCLCVSMPLKVKWLLTPKVTLIACTVISVVVFGWFAIIFGIYDIYWVFSPKYNQSVAVYRNNDFYYANKGPIFQYYNLSGIIWPTGSFVVIVVATVIIVYKLRESSKFRGQNSSDGRDKIQLSARDRQVVKMLVVIIAVYAVCLSPRIAHYITKYFIFDFYFLRDYHNLFLFVVCFLSIFDLTNGAINFFIFYKMSSSFRQTFLELFCNTKKQKNRV